MSRPNDQTRAARASPVATAAIGCGSTPAAATSNTIPCPAATVLRPVRGGSGDRSHGSIRLAAPKAYRMTPIASTHGPRDAATYTLRTRIKKASTSMSNRAPSGDAVPVRLATWPSTASRTSATAVMVTRSAAGSGVRTVSATSAATQPTSVARASVT